MSLIEVDTLADVARRRERMLMEAERDIERATARAVRRFLARMLDRVENGLTAALVASPSLPFATSSLFTLGELQGWWASEVDEHVTDAVARAWRLGHFDTSDLPLSSSSLAHSGEYLAKVTDRLSRTASPTIAEGAFDRVRVALADEMGRGSTTRDMTRRLGAELNWQGEQVPFWRERLGELDGTIDRILDPMGPPGTKAREAHRLNDPQIRELQARRSEIVQRLDRDASVWETRAERISRTETTGAYNAGALDAGHEEGAGVKVWIASADDRTRDTHLEVSGTCVGIDDTFDVGGALLEMPGDPSGAPEETINCRCTIVFDSSCEAAQGFTARADAVMDEERARREEADGVPRVTAEDRADRIGEGEVPEQPLREFGDLTAEAETTNLNRYQADALQDYQAGSDQYNDALRAGTDLDDMPLEDRMVVLRTDTAIRQSPALTEDVKVYRGVSDTSFLQDGQSFRDNAFVSTTGDVGTARAFAGQTGDVVEVVVPKGMKALNVDGSLATQARSGWGESELMLGRGTAFDVSRTDAGWRLTARIE